MLPGLGEGQGSSCRMDVENSLKVLCPGWMKDASLSMGGMVRNRSKVYERLKKKHNKVMPGILLAMKTLRCSLGWAEEEAPPADWMGRIVSI